MRRNGRWFLEKIMLNQELGSDGIHCIALERQLIRPCARLFIGSGESVFYLCAANGDVIF
jgi:hypothetical protein